MSLRSDPPLSALSSRLRAVLPEGAVFELAEGGFYGHRKKLGRGAAYRAVETVLADRPLRVFDFNMGPEDQAGNLHDGERFRDDYLGAPGAGEHSVFRVDHHFEVDDLRRDSTTPMVLRWLLARHESGDRETPATVATARYLADHCDVDILFAHHLAIHGRDEEYLRSVGPAFAAGALINDYGAAPEGSDPRGDRAYFAGLALENEITEERLGFAEVQDRWLPALGRWLGGGEPRDELATLKSWEAATRREEEEILERIEDWREEGRLSLELDGRLAWLQAPEEIDNLSFFRYLSRRLPRPGHRIQLLEFPSAVGAETVTYKLRSHDGFDLNPLYRKLGEILPEAGFGGRSAAGGSGHPIVPRSEEILAVLRYGLER